MNNDCTVRLCLSVWIFIVGIVFKVTCSKFSELKQDPTYTLANELLTDYRVDMLPKCIDTELPAKSWIDLLPINIIDVDEMSQTIQLNTWNRWYWEDCRLRWSPEDYNGTRQILISSKFIWIPDITLYDSATSHDFGEILQYKEAKIDYTGMVTFYFPYVHISTCHFNIIPFPHDFQRCRFKFGSWIYNGLQLDVINKNNVTDRSDYIESNEWKMLNFSVNRSVVHYSCCPEPFPFVAFEIELMRYPLHFHLNLILPCCLIHLVSIFMFIIPYDSGERISLGITCLLSMVVFSLTMADILPATSQDVPKTSLYFSYVIIQVACSTIINIIMVTLHQKIMPRAKLPVCVKYFFIHVIGTLLCMYQPCKSKCKSKKLEITENGKIDTIPSPEEEYRSNLQDWRDVLSVLDRLLFITGGLSFIILTYAIFSDLSILQ